MEGEEGRRMLGNNATEANSRRPRTGMLNVFLTQFINGISS